jgi:hypothetical protein
MKDLVTKERTMKPMAAAAIGALIAGVGMYAVGARAQNDPGADVPALVQTADGQYVRIPGAQPVAQPVAYTTALQSAPVALQRPATAQRTVYRTVTPASSSRRQAAVAEKPAGRSWKKTAMVIGGSTAGGAGIGGIVGGKKGALIGAALGGSAASIYEATKR